MTQEWMTFGEVRALAQRPPGVARDVALCEALRDSPRAWLREQGVLNYALTALCEGEQRARYLECPGELLRKLRRGELVGRASEAVLDLRGYKCPDESVFDAALAQNERAPIAHLILDHTMCGADWLTRLFRLGEWSSLRWLSLRGCRLAGELSEVLDATPSQVVGLWCGGNALNDRDILAVHDGPKCAALRWLDVSGSVASEEAFDRFIARAGELGVSWLGCDVSRAQGFGDRQLVEAMDAGVLGALMVWRSKESGVSEHGLPALLWALPAGQLEEISFGDARDERATHLDSEAVLALFEIPAFDTLHCMEWAHSDVVPRGQDPRALSDEEMVRGLARKPWLRGLERLGLHGLSLAALVLSGVFEHASGIRELAMTQCWCPYEMQTPSRYRAQEVRRALKPLIDEALRPMRLTHLELGFDDLDEEGVRRWHGWSHEICEHVIGMMIEVLDFKDLQRLVWHGELGVGHWLDRMGRLSSARLKHLICTTNGRSSDLRLTHLCSSSLIQQCPLIETDEESWLPQLMTYLRRSLTHPYMWRAVRGSTPHAAT